MNKRGFTLPELLTVITIIALLMMASFGALSRARELARRAKGEAQIRQLVSAWQQYYITYGSWPNNLAGQDKVAVSANNMKALIDPNDGNNPYGIVFFNFSDTGDFTDPWGTIYRLKFGANTSSTSGGRSTTYYETSVALPQRRTIMP